MKYCLLIGVLTAAMCVGCGDPAEQMLQVDANQGKMALAMKGSGKDLQDRYIISEHRTPKLSDGTVLDVWILIASAKATDLTEGQPRGTVLLIHDIGKSKASMLGLGQELSRVGYDVVLPDLRAHGRTSGKYFTYGAKEKTDLAALMDQLLRERTVDSNVYAFGRGMGGSIAIGYASIHPKCKGVIAQHPYAGPRPVLKKRPQFVLMSNDELSEVMEDGAKLGGFKLEETSTIQAARRLKCPLLILSQSNVFSSDVDSQAILDATNSPKLKENIASMEYALKPSVYLADKIDAFITGRIEIPGRTVIGVERDAPEPGSTGASDEPPPPHTVRPAPADSADKMTPPVYD
ncbi:hypothetical protein LCGC14_0284660 [marine sediment metagenome]|uniref:Serine aminopeptidase S33 domain-containing protein n=1 Tax=marine sediment metagenome TaxID=412755 RepID=A0A0F9UBT9_9ZZZZ|nr:alpha/beta hydrolase [Phycisphaerae bacterium]HDZ44999.1 alpha/beta hydrolase [Phycisphaerae bacterium]